MVVCCMHMLLESPLLLRRSENVTRRISQSSTKDLSALTRDYPAHVITSTYKLYPDVSAPNMEI